MKNLFSKGRFWAIALGLLTAISWQHAIAQTPTTTNDTICLGSSATLRAAGSVLTPDTNYRWYLSASSNAPIPGETGPTYTFQPRFSTTLYVALSNAGVVGSRSPVQVVVKEAPKNIFTFTPTNAYAFYSFNNGVNDNSGNGNNLGATGQGNATNRFGAGNGAAGFSGTTGAASVTVSSFDSATTPAFTYLTWIQTNDAGGGLIVGLGNQSNRAVLSTKVDRQLYLTADGTLRFRFGADSLAAGSGLNDNRWHFVAVSRTADGLVNLFIDGQIRATDSMKVGNDFRGYLRLVWDNLAGAPGNPTSFRLGCTLDDMRILNRALSVSELTALYQSPALRVRFVNTIACNQVTPIIRVINGQTTVKYSLIDMANNAVVAGPIIGRTDSITIPATFVASGNFKISSTDTVTGCTTVLDTTLRITVNANPLTPVPVQAFQQSCGNATFDLTVRGGAQGLYRWYTTPVGGLSTFSDSSRSITILQGDSAVFYVGQVTPQGCISPRVKVKAIAYPTILTATGSGLVSDVGLWAYLPFTGNVLDASGNARPTAIRNAGGLSYVADQYNQPSRAISFNGTNAVISIGNNNPAPAGDFSVAIWFRTTSTNGAKMIGFQTNQDGNGGSYDRQIYMASNGQINFGVFQGNVRATNSTRSYNDGQWHHAVGTVNTVTGLSLYVDGSLVASLPSATGGQSMNGWWLVGGGSSTGWPGGTGVTYFNGTLDEPRIYTRTLSANEVLQLRTQKGTALTQANNQTCGVPTAGSVTLRGITAGLSYQLQIMPSNTLVGSAVLATGDSVILTTNLIDSTTKYRVLALNPATGCNGLLDSTLTFFGGAKPAAPFTLNQSNCGTGNLTLSATGTTRGNFRWFNTATGGNPLSTDSLFTTPVIAAGDSAIYYVATVNAAGCESDRIRVMANTFALPINVANSLRNSLLHRWDFVNGSLNDQAGTNNGTAAGTVLDTTNVNGTPRSAKYFAGNAGDYVSFPNSYAGQLRPAYSIAFWMRTNTTNGGHIIGHSTTPPPGTVQERVVYLDNNNRLSFFHRNTNGANPANSYVRSAKALNDDKWHHIVATASATGIRLYVDGALVGTDLTGTTSQNNSRQWTIGFNGLNNVPNRPTTDAYQGFLDNVRIYRKALTETEILALNQDPLLTISTAGTSFCGTGSAKIRINNAQSNISYQLLQAGTAIGSPATAVGDSVIFNTPMLTTSTAFQISATNPLTNCAVTLDSTVSVTINPIPTEPIVNDTVRCGTGAALMRAKGATSGNFRWYTAPNAGLSIANTPTLSVTITLGAGVAVDSVIRYVSRVGAGGCEGPRMMIRARAFANGSVAPTVTTASTGFCLGDSTLLTANGTAPRYVWRNGTTIVSTNAGTLWVKTNGTYTAVALNGNLCASSTSAGVAITATAKPATPVISVINGTTPRVQVPALAGATFVWYFNGAVLTGQTTNSVSNPAPGAYRVLMTLRGCPADTTAPFLVTSMASYISGGTISVYPNPNAGQFKVTAADLTTDQATMQITDALGRTVLERQMFISNGTGTETIEAETLSNGVYYVKISAAGQSLLHRIVIQK